jgi:hypothetical protein
MGQGNVRNQLWGMNGFELTLVPEPSAVTLAAVGGVMVGISVACRRRRSRAFSPAEPRS